MDRSVRVHFMKFSARDVALVAAIMFAAALFGILTRPIGFLSAFWPANALLLGLMLRQPRLSTAYAWAGAFAGMVAADLVTGGTVLMSLWLDSSNVVGAFAGWLVLSHLPAEHRCLARPASIFHVLTGAAVAALAASLVGFGAAPQLLGTDLVHGFAFWTVSELVNYIVILPVVLTAPALADLHQSRRKRPVRLQIDLLPAVLLGASVILAHLVGGPGAPAIPIPALLWCAMRYSLFQTAVLTLITCAWQMIAFPEGVTPLPLGDAFTNATSSARLGVALLALAPLTVASVMRARNELLRKLDLAANHDHLTGVLNRGALVSAATALLSREGSSKGVAVLMFDLDHFKTINDGCGHLVGDAVLVAFASAMRAGLRDADLFGRFGGEEFVAVLPDIDRRGAVKIAERLRAAASRIVVACDGPPPKVSVSVGVATAQFPVQLDSLLSLADRALYHAKAAGRDRVATGTVPVAAPPTRREPGKIGLAA